MAYVMRRGPCVTAEEISLHVTATDLTNRGQVHFGSELQGLWQIVSISCRRGCRSAVVELAGTLSSPAHLYQEILPRHKHPTSTPPSAYHRSQPYPLPKSIPIPLEHTNPSLLRITQSPTKTKFTRSCRTRRQTRAPRECLTTPAAKTRASYTSTACPEVTTSAFRHQQRSRIRHGRKHATRHQEYL